MAVPTLHKGILINIRGEVYCLNWFRFNSMFSCNYPTSLRPMAVNHCLAIRLEFFIFQCKCGTWPRQPVIDFLMFECVVCFFRNKLPHKCFAHLQNSEVYQGRPASLMVFFLSSTSNLIYYQSSIFKLEKIRYGSAV